MNRFRTQHHLSTQTIWQLFSITLVLGFLIFFFSGIHTVSTTTKEEQIQSLESAIHRSMVHCYSIEGTYPPSLEYLEQHYGLIYDKKNFYVDYMPIGSNILPDVTVIALE